PAHRFSQTPTKPGQHAFPGTRPPTRRRSPEHFILNRSSGPGKHLPRVFWERLDYLAKRDRVTGGSRRVVQTGNNGREEFDRMGKWAQAAQELDTPEPVAVVSCAASQPRMVCMSSQGSTVRVGSGQPKRSAAAS